MTDFDKLRLGSNRSQQGTRPKFAQQRDIHSFAATLEASPSAVRKIDFDNVKINLEESTLQKDDINE